MYVCIYIHTYGRFHKLEVPVVGSLIVRALPCGVYVGTPGFWKLSHISIHIHLRIRVGTVYVYLHV